MSNSASQKTPPPRILIVDDNPGIHSDFRKILADHEPSDNKLAELQSALFGDAAAAPVDVAFDLESAFQGEEALKKVEQTLADGNPFHLAFVDVRMPPGWDGVETLEAIWKVDPDLQAVICTAYSDYSWKDIRQRLGRRDNLVILKKPFETVEVLQLAHALTRKWQMTREARLRMEDLDRMVTERTQALQAANGQLQTEITERTRAQAALRISEERFATAFLSGPLPMAILSHPEGRFVNVNDSFQTVTGRTGEELLGMKSAAEIWDTDDQRWLTAFQPGRPVRNRPARVRARDGDQREVRVWAQHINLLTGGCVLLTLEDVTQQLRLEAQLRQTHKMEAVGRLAAGVAHEFNNILTVIQGHAELLVSQPGDSKMVREFSGRISLAGKRAARLVSQLLTFSRKQPVQLKAVILSDVVSSTHKMLMPLLGERHNISFKCGEDLPPVLADEGSLEQILINMCVNARDAMPDGGTIEVETGVHTFDDTVALKNPDARGGRFVSLSIKDSGCGMSREKAARIFDPFFTTKDIGKGTGLGLSTVLGLTRQHNGWIDVLSSEDGGGTVFTVYLPVARLEEPAVAVGETGTPRAADDGQGETILVVEDEPAVRELARATLERGGYRVVEAADSTAALTILEQRPAIDLLLTDLMLPGGLNGGKLAARFQERRPGMPVIYISGYGSEIIRENLPDRLRTGINFLSKPFDPYSLLQAVQTSLGAIESAQELIAG